MKKLLSILGTITIAGGGMSGIVGNAPAPAKQETKLEKETILKRNKRKVFSNSLSVKYDPKIMRNEILATFTPEIFEDIIYNKGRFSDFNKFQSRFYGLMYTGIWKDHRINENSINNLAKCIWNNWETILKKWNDSDKEHSIRVICWGFDGSFRDAYIRY